MKRIFSQKTILSSIFFALFLVLCLFYFGCISPESQFDALTKEIFIDYASHDTLTLNYTLKDPSVYDISLNKVTWGEVPVTPEDFDACKQKTKDYLVRLNEISGLTGDRALTYDVLKYYLELELESYDYIYFTTNFLPMLGIQSQLPIAMAEYPFDDVQDLNDYISLLNLVDDYFSDLIAFENAKAAAGYGMCRTALLSAIEDCKAFCADIGQNMLIEVFPEKLNALHLTDNEKQAYIKENASAIKSSVLPAYKNVIEALTKQLDTAPESGSLSSYKNGSNYYAYLLKAAVGTDKTAEDLIALTEGNLIKDFTRIGEILLQSETSEDSFLNPAYISSDPIEILKHFKDTLTAKQFPKAPAVSCALKTVHPSIAESLSPAMYIIPRIDDMQTNQIYLNLTGSDASNELMPTLAHEGYPGHMYQTTYYYNTNPNPIRTIYENDGYVEGWATYVEGLSYDYCGLNSNVAEFTRLFNLEITLNLFCRLDLGIHYENWTLEDAYAFASQYLNVDKSAFSSLYTNVLLQPANYLIYGIGMEEILELQENQEKHLGTDFDASEFHKQLLDIGPAPFPIVKKYTNIAID